MVTGVCRLARTTAFDLLHLFIWMMALTSRWWSCPLRSKTNANSAVFGGANFLSLTFCRSSLVCGSSQFIEPNSNLVANFALYLVSCIDCISVGPVCPAWRFRNFPRPPLPRKQAVVAQASGLCVSGACDLQLIETHRPEACATTLRRLTLRSATGFSQRENHCPQSDARQTTRASPLPLTTSPMRQASCFCDWINFSTASALSAATMATMPMPMLKT